MIEAGEAGDALSGGHYRLGAALTTTVRAARDTWADRDVVAVALAPDGGAVSAAPGSEGLTRVARDVRRAAEHPHPGLSPARDVAAGADRRLWLVHEVPRGVHGLAAVDPLSPARLLRLALVLAGALAAAHAARLVHGAIGANVVLVEAAGGADAVLDGGGGRRGAWLLGAPSGVRPVDRPAAEDDDTRALAATLAAVPVLTDTEPELAERLATAFARAAHARPDLPGALGPALRADLRALAADEPDLGADAGVLLGDAATGPRPEPRPDPQPHTQPGPVRHTEVISTAAATDAWSPGGAAGSHGAPTAPLRAEPGAVTARVGLLPPTVPPSPPPPRRPGTPGGASVAPPVRPPSAGPPVPAGRRPLGRGRLLVLAIAAVLVLLGAVLAAVLVLGGGTTPTDGPDGPGSGHGDLGGRVVPALVGEPTSGGVRVRPS